MTLIIATIFYSIQIYCDFSGYSDIAIGISKFFGIKLNQNFNIPYFSTSVTEFWRKWHISLSSWLKEYIYITLGGNRIGKLYQYRNLIITMFIGGLWHGADVKFIIWGVLHGIVLSIEKMINLSKRVCFLFRSIYTFLVVSFIWIFFRSESIADSIIVSKKILSSNPLQLHFINNSAYFLNIFFLITILIIHDAYLFVNQKYLETFGSSLNNIILSIIITFIMLFIFLFSSSYNNFIYFQF